MEYRYSWDKILSFLTFTKREITSIKNEVYDHFQNWTSLKGEVFLQIKAISEKALTGLLYIYIGYNPLFLFCKLCIINNEIMIFLFYVMGLMINFKLVID